MVQPPGGEWSRDLVPRELQSRTTGGDSELTLILSGVLAGIFSARIFFAQEQEFVDLWYQLVFNCQTRTHEIRNHSEIMNC
jgi:hypothetical protein